MEEEMLYMMKKISLNWTMQLKMQLKSKNMTGIQVYFVVYILRHHPEGTYLTELYREIGISKATLSAMIKKLRNEGYLYVETDFKDIRKKKVLPTEKLMADKEMFLKQADKVEYGICKVLDQQEKKNLLELEHKILAQFEGIDHEQIEKKDGRFYKNEKSLTAVGEI